jgi:hypothetical protein
VEEKKDTKSDPMVQRNKYQNGFYCDAIRPTTKGGVGAQTNKNYQAGEDLHTCARGIIQRPNNTPTV